MTDMHVLIVGAGMTGLLIAHGLQKEGIKFTIFEAEQQGRFRPREWTMGIHWGLPLMEALLPQALADRIIPDASVDGSLDYSKPPNNGARIWDGVTGEVLKDLATPGRMTRLSRRKIRALLQEGIDVKYGHVLKSIECDETARTVTAVFANGESCSGSLLLGADGPRSPVRNFLFASNVEAAQGKAMDGAITHSFAVTYADPAAARAARSAHPVWSLCIHPEIVVFMSLQDVPDPDKPETWKFFLFPSWYGQAIEGSTNEQRMKIMKDKAQKLAEPFRTMILEVPDNTELAYSEMLSWIAKKWDTRQGLVTLAGDASHPMPPFRGQGGNHAIQDAFNFVDIVKQIVKAPDSKAELIQAYSDEVAGRGAQETELSMKNRTMMMDYYNFKDSPYAKQGLLKG